MQWEAVGGRREEEPDFLVVRYAQQEQTMSANG